MADNFRKTRQSPKMQKYLAFRCRGFEATMFVMRKDSFDYFRRLVHRLE